MPETIDTELVTQPGVCANCGEALEGEFCHSCGERQTGSDWLSVAPFIRQIGNELITLDFKSVHTVAALLRPGHLTAQYLAGRRRVYLGPVKIYFLCAALYFLVAPYVAGFNLAELMQQDPDGMLSAMVQRRIAETNMDFARFSERFDHRMQTVYTLSLGVSVVAAALILKVLYRRPLFGVHVVFALHYVSFLYLEALTVGALYKALGRPHPLVSLLLVYAILIPYVFLALRRVYREPAGLSRPYRECPGLLLRRLSVEPDPVNIAGRHAVGQPGRVEGPAPSRSSRAPLAAFVGTSR